MSLFFVSFTIKTIINVSKYDKKLFWRIENLFYSARLNMIPDKPAFFLCMYLPMVNQIQGKLSRASKCNKSLIPCGVKLAKYSPSVQNVCFCQNKQNVSKNRQKNDKQIAMDKNYRTIDKVNNIAKYNLIATKYRQMAF